MKRSKAKERARRSKDARLRKTYGLSLAQYEAMLRSQGGRCAVCGGDNGGRTLCVDHDHKTGRVRGALCFRCNKYLVGRHRDGKLLRAAADYLDSGVDWRRA